MDRFSGQRRSLPKLDERRLRRRMAASGAARHAGRMDPAAEPCDPVDVLIEQGKHRIPELLP
jgi:hypothetical protein